MPNVSASPSATTTPTPLAAVGGPASDRFLTMSYVDPQGVRHSVYGTKNPAGAGNIVERNPSTGAMITRSTGQVEPEFSPGRQAPARAAMAQRAWEEDRNRAWQASRVPGYQAGSPAQPAARPLMGHEVVPAQRRFFEQYARQFPQPEPYIAKPEVAQAAPATIVPNPATQAASLGAAAAAQALRGYDLPPIEQSPAQLAMNAARTQSPWYGLGHMLRG